MPPFSFRLGIADTGPEASSEVYAWCDVTGHLLWAMRVWAAGWGRGDDPSPLLRPSFDSFGAGEAYVALRELFGIVWQTASRPLVLAELGAARPSPDERRLLSALRQASAGDLEACRQSLAELLCPLGARRAVLPAWGLARALAGLESDRRPFEQRVPRGRA